MAAQILAEDLPAARVRVLTLSQPARKNAVDADALNQLVHQLSRAAADRVRAVVLAGEGGVFCAGSDLSAVGAASDRLHANQIALDPNQNGLHANDFATGLGEDELPDAPLGRACAALEASPFPIVAAIDGPAFGAGAELCCACDLRVASSSSRFSFPPARLGLVYSPEGTARVVRLLGLGQAKRLFFTAAVLDAAEALRIGLCQEVTAAPSALPRALELASQLAQLSPRSHAGMKRTFALLAQPLSSEARAELASLRREAFTSRDAQEGRAAFLERRAPKFSDE